MLSKAKLPGMQQSRKYGPQPGEKLVNRNRPRNDRNDGNTIQEC